MADVELAISPEKVCAVAALARRWDAKDAVTETDVASNPADDLQAAVLENHPDDPALRELVSLINGLSEDEQIDLVALAWLGRGDDSVENFESLRQAAAEAHNTRTARYLCGTPLLGDYLQEGLAQFDLSCEEFEPGRPDAESPEASGGSSG
ncbi:hypothetical protein SLNSH_08525 [Alsobacter soli]|uniref:DUF3775 domain-containing protein n=1 Tax=Alsobacter soli TaxID=2109933 RepID=A0A2T1HVE7_9HYPH|nr:DUF3775 domain-containing protein [Alsobacter soli]PSC05611.1 hypothetical protein SLNSH_08525 [Alsobacter soli]